MAQKSGRCDLRVNEYTSTDRDPVLSSRVPLPDSWRVLKTRKDSDSHPPPLPAGAYRFAPDPVQKSESESRKGRKGKKDQSRATRLAQQRLCTICEFCMIFVALIPVMNYNAQIAFKRGQEYD